MKIYEIEKNVLPLQGNTNYPFHKMEVGDSFRFEGDEKEARTLRSAGSMHGARTGTKFSTKKDGSGYRVWRVK